MNEPTEGRKGDLTPGAPRPAPGRPTKRARRPRGSAGLTRSRLLAILRERGAAGASSRELAADLGLHPNTVREQLERLTADGLARRHPEPPAGRGRPALRHMAIPQADDVAPYRDLARALAGELARLPDAGDRAESAGERWGRAAVGATDALAGRTAGRTAPLEALVAVLDAGGFAPEPPVEGGPIRLRRCPFGALARERRSIVCGIHLGLMRGALAELGAPVDAVRLDPFVEPDLCLAHVDAASPAPTRSRGGGARARRSATGADGRGTRAS